MHRIASLAHALDRFGFDEQASACRRLHASRAQSFQADSQEWANWANAAENRIDDELSPEEFETWILDRAAALKAFEQLASPSPPLTFDTLGDPLPPVANSLIKVPPRPLRIALSLPHPPPLPRHAPCPCA